MQKPKKDSTLLKKIFLEKYRKSLDYIEQKIASNQKISACDLAEFKLYEEKVNGVVIVHENIGNGGVKALNKITKNGVAVFDGAYTGKYVLDIESPSGFILKNPAGVIIGEGSVGVPFKSDGLLFTLAHGSIDFVSRDKFQIEVSPVSLARNIDLIVPEVTYLNNNGDLNNQNWVYNVNYGFRDALDISYDSLRKTLAKVITETIDGKYVERKEKQQMIVMKWTQGSRIGFKTGDILTSTKGYVTLQLTDAMPVFWNQNTAQVDYGFVAFKHFTDDLKTPAIFDPMTLTQMDFLDLLIYGKNFLCIK